MVGVFILLYPCFFWGNTLFERARIVPVLERARVRLGEPVSHAKHVVAPAPAHHLVDGRDAFGALVAQRHRTLRGRFFSIRPPRARSTVLCLVGLPNEIFLIELVKLFTFLFASARGLDNSD